MRALVLLLLIGVTACGGPVRATNCQIISNPRHGTVLQAMLVNNSGKTVTYVGVLIQRVGVEYEFPIHIGPHASTPVIVGTPYGGQSGPIPRNQLGPIGDLDCWARAVSFADGTVWSVSPL
jgi:hypothetical protein